jgi:hypothetical protein
MNSRMNTGRALAGYLELARVSYRRPLLMFSVILGGIVSGLIAFSALGSTRISGSGTVSAGALTGGMMAAIITLGVMGFRSASDEQMSRVFAFPMNRKVLLLGNFLVVTGVAFSFTYVLGVASGLEALLGRFVASLVPRLLYTNTITLQSWVVGFWISASYLALCMSAAYGLGMYFYRYKLFTITIGSALIVSFFVNPAVFQKALKVFEFFIFEGSPVALSVKLWGATVLFHALTLMPLARMEVRS